MFHDAVTLSQSVSADNWRWLRGLSQPLAERAPDEPLTFDLLIQLDGARSESTLAGEHAVAPHAPTVLSL